MPSGELPSSRLEKPSHQRHDGDRRHDDQQKRDHAYRDAEVKKIDPAVLLNARLYPDMFPLAQLWRRARQTRLYGQPGHAPVVRHAKKGACFCWD
jgi:hypothetical protein